MMVWDSYASPYHAWRPMAADAIAMLVVPVLLRVCMPLVEMNWVEF